MSDCDECLFQDTRFDIYDGVFVDSCGAGYDIDHDGDCAAYSKDESI